MKHRRSLARERGAKTIIAGVTALAALSLGVPGGPAYSAPPSSARPAVARTSESVARSYVIWPASVQPAVRAVRTRARTTLGTRFAVRRAGTISALRFYKAASNTGSHTGTLWTASGRRLASVRFSHETRSGWQQAQLAHPVRVVPGRRYVVAYGASHGHFSTSKPNPRRSARIVRGPLTALGGSIGHHGRFPGGHRSASYFVDVVFRPGHHKRPTRPAPVVTAPPGGTPTAPDPGPAPVPPTAPAPGPTPAPGPAPAPPPSTTAFPNASSTGSSGTLTKRAGLTITTNGTVIENALITGQVTVRADNVVLRNVTVKSSDTYGILNYGNNTVIDDTTVIGTAGATLAGIAGVDGSFIVHRADVSGSEDGVRLTNNSTLADSYVHGLAGTSTSHYDGVTADGWRGWTINHNTIVNNHDQTAAVWIGDPRYDPSEGVLSNNFLAGGGYTLYAGPGAGAGLRVLNNVWSTSVWSDAGSYGPVAYWDDADNTWSGNTWADGPKAGKPLTP